MPAAPPIRQNRTVRLLLSILVSVSAAFGAADSLSVAEWVQRHGGHVEVDAAGDVVAIDLSNTWITDADMSRLSNLQKLEQLTLSQTRITDVGMESLAALRGVRELDLRFAEFVSEFGVANLKAWNSLESLNLRGTMVRSQVFETIGALVNLRELDLSHTRITDDSFDKLAELRRLEALSIGSNRLDGSALEVLKLLPSLRRLDLRGVQRVDSGIWGLALNPRNLERIAELTQLRELLLGGATITDVGADRPGREDAERSELPHLEVLASLKQIETLDLSRQPITLEEIAFLPKLPELRELNLGQCVQLGDETVKLLVALPSIEVLYLAGTALTDEGLQALTAVALDRLALGGEGVTKAGVEAYQAARPTAKVTWFESAAFTQVRAAQ